jgi:hypothetical protein
MARAYIRVTVVVRRIDGSTDPRLDESPPSRNRRSVGRAPAVVGYVPDFNAPRGAAQPRQTGSVSALDRPIGRFAVPDAREPRTE